MGFPNSSGGRPKGYLWLPGPSSGCSKDCSIPPWGPTARPWLVERLARGWPRGGGCLHTSAGMTIGWSKASPNGHPNGGETQGLPSKPPLGPSGARRCGPRWYHIRLRGPWSTPGSPNLSGRGPLVGRKSRPKATRLGAGQPSPKTPLPLRALMNTPLHPAGFSCCCRWVGRADHRRSPQTLSGGTRASKGWSRVSPLGSPAATSGYSDVLTMIARRPSGAAWPGPRESRDGLR